MLNKLLKYDFKIMGKQLLPYFVIVIISALLSRGVDLLIDWIPAFGFFATPIKAIFIILLVASFFYTFFVSIERYYKNIFKDEGYLTNTLPVTKNQILLSKTISATIFFLLNVFVIILALFIAYGNIFSFLGTFHDLLREMNFNIPLAYTLVVLILFTGYISYILMIYVSIGLGHTKNDRKVMYSVIYGFIVYTATQFIGFIELGILFLMDRTYFTNLSSNVIPSVSIVSNTFIISIIGTVLVTIAYYWGAKYLLEKKLNLD